MKRKARQLLLMLLISSVFAMCPCLAEETTAFSDVLDNEWYSDSVEYVFKNGLMNGTSQTTFDPEISVTRGMIVTIIYRMEGSPKVQGNSRYIDVDKEQYYYLPIMWAAEKGIVNGYSKEVFAPEDKITREQFATILYRYADYKDLDVSFDFKTSENLKMYNDNDLISNYAKDAICWANYSRLITGTSATTLEPQGNATRAQAATIFMRFDKWMGEAENETPTHTNNTDKESEKDKETNYQGVYLKVNDADGASGNTVEVNVSLENNPGIMGIMISFEYDEKAMKLVKVLNGDVLTDKNGYVFTSPRNMASGCRATWYTLEDEYATTSGMFVTLVFEVFDSTQKGPYPITVKCDPDNVIDKNEENLALEIINGQITIN